MANRRSWQIVVDASVARAAGGVNAVHPGSKHCRDFLLSMLQICHRVIMTEDVFTEWKKHESNFAKSWRRGMIARRKLVYIDPNCQNKSLERIDQLNAPKNEKLVMKKDAHLILGALKCDGIVVSIDNEARGLFANATKEIPNLKIVRWINPTEDAKSVNDWLERGSKLSVVYRLSAFRSEV